MTEIILVRYKMKEMENECIRSVLDNTTNYNLTVYDNEEHNYNLGKLWNSLISASSAEIICLLNTDTAVEPFWLERLEYVLTWDKVGAVGLVTDGAKNSQKQGRGSGVFELPKEEMLSGFCLLFYKRVWEEVGGFPEDFGFYGQETAMMKKVQSKGYRQMVNREVFVHHEGSATAKSTGLDLEQEREKGRNLYQLFKNKFK